MNDNNAILMQAAAWRREGHDVALAVVTETWGSSPRPVGSRLAVDSAGRFVGSVSGGCVEAVVIEVADEIIRTGKPRVLEFGVSDENAWSVGLACGGTVRIFIERLD